MGSIFQDGKEQPPSARRPFSLWFLWSSWQSTLMLHLHLRRIHSNRLHRNGQHHKGKRKVIFNLSSIQHNNSIHHNNQATPTATTATTENENYGTNNWLQ